MTVQEEKQAATRMGTAQVPPINGRRRISRQAVDNAVRQIGMVQLRAEIG